MSCQAEIIRPFALSVTYKGFGNAFSDFCKQLRDLRILHYNLIQIKEHHTYKTVYIISSKEAISFIFYSENPRVHYVLK